jgi:hypothetical protein
VAETTGLDTGTPRAQPTVMKKTAKKRMALSKESIRNLRSTDLDRAAGGIDLTLCPSCGPFCPGPAQSTSFRTILD